MSLSEVIQVISSFIIVGLVGGLFGVFSGIILTLFTQFGDFLTKRRLESIRKEHQKEIHEFIESTKIKNQKEINGRLEALRKANQKEIEEYKKEYQKEIEEYKNELDMLKERTMRYSGKQFSLYNKLWFALHALKKTADNLWKKANNPNLGEFYKQLAETEDKIEKSFLFIEDSHYDKLKMLLEQFRNFKAGKEFLIELFEKKSVSSQKIRQTIDNNRNIKYQYEELIKEIKEDLKSQLRGL